MSSRFARRLASTPEITSASAKGSRPGRFFHAPLPTRGTVANVYCPGNAISLWVSMLLHWKYAWLIGWILRFQLYDKVSRFHSWKRCTSLFFSDLLNTLDFFPLIRVNWLNRRIVKLWFLFIVFCIVFYMIYFLSFFLHLIFLMLSKIITKWQIPFKFHFNFISPFVIVLSIVSLRILESRFSRIIHLAVVQITIFCLNCLFPAGNRKNHHWQQQQFQRNERERTKNVENFLHNFQPKLNFHSLSNSIHSISALKDKYRIKNTRIPSQYNFQLRTSKSPSFRLLATILFTYSYRDRQINNSKRENTREKREFSFRRPIKIHHFENNAFPQRIDTWLSRYLLSLGAQVSKRETSILNLAAGGRRMESLFLSLFETRLLLHLSAPVLDLCSTFHRSRRRSSVTRLLPPLLRPSPYASVS